MKGYLAKISALVFCLFLFLIAKENKLAQIPFDIPENIESINSKQHDYCPQPSNDDRYLFFQSNRPGFLGSYNLWVSMNLVDSSTRESSLNWTKAVPLSFPLKQLDFLEQTKKPEGKLKEKLKNNKKVKRPEGFSVNTDGFEANPNLLYMDAKASEFYFTYANLGSAKEATKHDLDIYVTRKKRGKWTKPEALEVINSNFDDRMPSTSFEVLPASPSKKLKKNKKAELFLAFSSNRPGGFGGDDIWISKRDTETDSWSHPKNAGSTINSSYNESTPSFSYNKNSMRIFFSSNRPGGFGYYDIYTSLRLGDKWEDPVNLGNLNSSRDDECFKISQNGRWAYFSSDRRNKKAKGDFDIYRIKLPLWLYDISDILFTGQILDGSFEASSKEVLGLDATIHIYQGDYKSANKRLLTTSSIFSTSKNSDLINNFRIALPAGVRYRVLVSAPGFIPQEIELDYERERASGDIDRRIIILKKKGAALLLPDICPEAELSCLDKIKIYFESNQVKIKKSETNKIEAIFRILHKMPTLRILIAGHTDTTNTFEYNKKLSVQRAQAIQKALLNKGIKLSRLELRGYSFEQPVLKEKSNKAHKLNRRVEFIKL